MARAHSKPSSRSDRGGGKGKPHAVGSLYGKDTKPYKYGVSKNVPLVEEPSAEELKAYKKPLNQIDPDTPGHIDGGV